jgi:CheY-like chemotaxis protein
MLRVKTGTLCAVTGGMSKPAVILTRGHDDRHSWQKGSIPMADRAIRVLVVDDDRSIRETLRAVLQDEGYTVAEAGDGAQAIALLRAFRDPHVVLTDLRMPVMDGIKLLELVAADDALVTRHAYTVITANPDTVPSAVQATRGRFSLPVLTKPFDLDDVLTHVAQTGARLIAGHELPPDVARDARW